MAYRHVCRRCREPFAQYRGETLCRRCRKTVVLRRLPSDEAVRGSLTHFRRPVEILDGEAVVEARGGLRLVFEILERPDWIASAVVYVRFLKTDIRHEAVA